MTDEELQVLTEIISLQFFNKPFLHHAIFNQRLRTTGGRYLLTSHNIEINHKYYDEHGLEELKGIIKHELCHYHLHIEGKGYRHGDDDFKQLMKQTGAPRHCSPIADDNFRLYKCKECTQIYKRKRRINTSKYVCGKCRGKLEEVKK